jgi:hypothetical protein
VGVGVGRVGEQHRLECELADEAACAREDQAD